MEIYKLNFQIGGDIINKNTIENNDTERARTLNQLRNLNINCAETNGINKFRLQRNGDNIYYNYNCLNEPSIPNRINEDKISREYYGTGENIYLDKHNINCNNKPITQLNLVRPYNSSLEYHYKCGSNELKDLREYHTEYQDNGNGENIYLDKHNVECPSTKLLSQIHLETNRANPNLIRYQFTCGILTGEYNQYIPDKLPETQSWLFMPLIYNNLENVTIRFPDGFIEIFNLCIQIYNENYKIIYGSLDFNNFDDFNQIIRRKLNIFNLRSRNDILDRRTKFYEDSHLHIPADQQTEILYINEAYQTFIGLFTQIIISRLAGRMIVIQY